MTREEAMYLLNNLRSVAEGKEDEAIDMAIEALSAELNATKTEKSSNCGDLISRADAIDALGEEPPVWYDGEDEIAERNQWRRDKAAIESLPSADRPTGRWVRSGNTLICPICGAKGEDIKDDYCFNYCPNCGTKMETK